MAKPGRIAVCCPDAPLCVNAALPLLTLLNRALECSNPARDPADAASLHRLRIAVKRLRYTLEILSGVVPGSEGFLATLRTLQDELGAVHDADVLVPLIEADMKQGRETPGLRALLEQTRQERLDAFRRFTAVWGAAEQADFATRLAQAALDAGRACAASAPTTRGDVPPAVRAAVADSTALLRLVPFCTGLRRGRAGALSRAVSRLEKAFRADGDGAKAKAISRGNRRLARALADAAR